MKQTPVAPIRLENPLGIGYEGRSRFKPKDNFPYVVIPKAPGFKIGKFKFPDQELVAMKCIANDKARLFRHYFSYFIKKVNNILEKAKVSWYVVGVITPSFDYAILRIEKIKEEDAKSFDVSKNNMLELMDQYRRNVYITNDYMAVERASLDPSVKEVLRFRYNHWILFIPSALKFADAPAFVELSDDVFNTLFDYRDATMEDLDNETTFKITFTDMEGNELEHCTPISIGDDDFNIQCGLDCSFSFSVESEQYEVNKAYIDDEELVPNGNIYTIHRVTKDIVVKVDVAFGEFAFDFEAINCVLANSPKRVNRDTEYQIPYAVLGHTYEVRSIESTGADASYNSSTRLVTVSNVTDNVELIIKAHDMIDVTVLSGDNYSYELIDGTTSHTERYHDFKFTVTPNEGYEVSKVYFYRPKGPMPPMPIPPKPCNCGCESPVMPQIPLSPITGTAHKEVVLFPINGTYVFTPTMPTSIHIEVKPIEQEGE